MKNNDFLIKLLFKLLIAFLFIPITLGAIWFVDIFKKLLRRAIKTKGRVEVGRLLSYKGLFGIFDLIERRSPRKR